MKALKFSIGIICILGLFSIEIFAENRLSKEINREFDVNEATSFIIKNKYGNIDIYNWEDDRMQIDVNIWVEHKNEDKAQKLLDYITVNINKEGDIIEAYTEIDEGFNRASSSIFEQSKFSIDYTIKIPDYIKLDLENKYGNTFINKITGLSTINIKYGNLTINEIIRDNDQPMDFISLGYSNGTIEKCEWLKCEIKYSNLKIEEGKALILYSRYSKAKIGETSSIVTDSKYDSYDIGKLKNLVIESEYGNFKIQNLSGKLESDSKYTHVKIDYIPENFENINIDNKNGSIKIGIDDNASYIIDGEADYCDIEYPRTANVNRIVDNNNMIINGLIGKNKQTSSKIYIRSKYGHVSLID
ncbi:MAG: hypothetical protein JXB17_10290 [Bacteroidales bacterium]|nr:hypothetical protein [Bacteroidales bacterium]